MLLLLTLNVTWFAVVTTPNVVRAVQVQELAEQVKQLEEEMSQVALENNTLQQQLASAQEQTKRAESSLQENFGLVMYAREANKELVQARKVHRVFNLLKDPKSASCCQR